MTHIAEKKASLAQNCHQMWPHQQLLRPGKTGWCILLALALSCRVHVQLGKSYLLTQAPLLDLHNILLYNILLPIFYKDLI